VSTRLGSVARPKRVPDERPLLIDAGIARASPALFAVYASRGRWVVAPHLSLIDDAFLDCVTLGNQRILIEMPPRHGKSELGSKHAPAWIVGVRPDWRVILASYESDFAATWGLKARTLLEEHGKDVFGVVVSSRSSARNRWDLQGREGGMVTAGVRGAITGRGAHVLMIDDPVKNAEEAASPKYRTRTWEWFTSTAMTRLEPGGSCVITQTRWHEGDLIGQCIAEQGLVEEGGVWRRIRLPAIAEEDGDVLGRSEGEALWPARYDAERLDVIRLEQGTYFWNALYQQRPAPLEGGMLKRGWWRHWIEDPVQDGREWDAICTSWDTNFRGGATSDFVVGQVWARKDGSYYLLDQVRGPWNFPETLKAIRDLIERWPIVTAHVIEKAANGEAVLASLRDEIGGLIGESPVGSKEARVSAVSGLIEAGSVYLPDPRRHPWVSEFIEECASFPNALHDDMVDAMSQGLRRLKLTRVTSAKPLLR
jgi:predicted phage terminase large subunit-like protein